MPRITIHQFRALLAGVPGRGAIVHAYRELARRPGLATEMRAAGWVAWPDGASARQPG